MFGNLNLTQTESNSEIELGLQVNNGIRDIAIKI